jgi:hypothetical protein
MSYSYLDQSITASCLIQPHDNDSFYNPTTANHYGYAANGNYYTAGVYQPSVPQASWYTESPGPYRGDGSTFPTAGLVLLSTASMAILDQSTPTSDPTQLPLWMLFILGDTFALANNWGGVLNGWTPTALTYADGVISVIYSPDAGNLAMSPPVFSPPVSPPLNPPSTNSIMVVTFDFSQDNVYLDIAF